MSDPVLLLRLLLLLGVANTTPILAKRILKARFGTPLDLGWELADGRRLFGKAKTIRGVVLSLACTAAAAPLMGLGWSVGLALAAGSMAGDLISSFVKRRIGLPPHAQASGLDQIPEALLPLILVRQRFELTLLDLALLVGAFVVAEILLSRLLFRAGIRDRPY